MGRVESKYKREETEREERRGKERRGAALSAYTKNKRQQRPREALTR